MDTLSNEIKRYLSIYSKNTVETSLDISIGHSLGKYIFDTHVSNKYWKRVYDTIEERHEYNSRKEFTHRIYTDYNKKLFVDTHDKKHCIEKGLNEGVMCYNNLEVCDFKISLYDRKMVNIAAFPPKYKYSNVHDRQTVSYKFNGFFINLSIAHDVDSGHDTHAITILFTNNTKTSRNIIIKNLMKQLRMIYSLYKYNLNEVELNVHHITNMV